MSNEDEKRSDELQEMLQNEVNKIGEHFDSVIVIATNSYGDDYVRHKASSGSIYTNYGAAKEWVIAYEEKIKTSVRKEDEE
jgi:epoxyqueuosine reductase QueG